MSRFSPIASAVTLALAAGSLACATQRADSPTLDQSEEALSAGLRAEVTMILDDMDPHDRDLLRECLTRVSAGDRSYGEVLGKLACYPSLRTFRTRVQRYVGDHKQLYEELTSAEEWMIGDVVLETVREKLAEEPA